jgi:outer membrane protein assembly factor BamB
MLSLANLFAVLLAVQETWPTLHKDAQRSGFTAETVQGPYERKWFRDFHDEMIASRVEAIVAEGKCFVGSFAGRFHALNVADGSTAWTFEARGAIGHSALHDSGRVVFGSDDGKLYCLKASDGSLIWTCDVDAGIWVAPAGDGEKVYFGDRAGAFHAVALKDGRPAWKFRTDGMILKPASLSPDGKRILFGSEDMHVYCLAPDGKLLWKSKKLQGLSLRDEAPTIWKGMAIVRTSPADGFHEVMNRNQDFMAKVQKGIPLGPQDKVINDKYAAYILRYSPERHKAEQEAVVKYLVENPHDQTFYALKLEDGTEPWTAPVFYTCGLHNPPTAPAFNPNTGECYTYYRTCLTNYSRGVRPFTGVGRIDPATGLVENLWHAQGDEPGWSDFATIGDETQSLSLMGEILLSTHQGTIGGLHPVTRKWFPVYNGRDTYGGIFGPGALPGGWEGEKKFQREGYLVNMCNEWHGPDRSILAIAEKRMFWVVGSQVVCWGGPDTPKAESGGKKPLAPWKKKFDFVVTAGGNLTADRVGGFDDKIERIAISADRIRPFLDPPAAPKLSAAPLALSLRAKLDAAVTEVVEGRTWAPFVVELGISKEERHFTQPGETLQILSLALPHLSPQAKEKALGYLGGLFDAGFPADAPARPRELYDPGPGMRKFAAQPRPPAPRTDLYATWAWAHGASAWDKALAREAELRKAFDDLKPAKIDPRAKDAGARANAQIAAALGYARLMRKAGKADEEERALGLLAELVTDRVHHERADTNFIREVRGAHSGSIPRYHDLAPEAAAMLHAFAAGEFERNVRALNVQLPVWHQAFAERMAGGENYTHTPLIARGLFAALADGLKASPDELASKLDHPWCRADLYYIEKLTASLRALDRP